MVGRDGVPGVRSASPDCLRPRFFRPDLQSAAVVRIPAEVCHLGRAAPPRDRLRRTRERRLPVRVDPSALHAHVAALPLLFMGDVHLDTAVIDRTPPLEWHSGPTAFTHATKFLFIDNDANRLLNASRFMIVLCGIGLGILVFAWTYEWLGL